ncbi:hypothetical protein HY949_02450 [Candidatus Gottesmanbacteria bacterium]|nr:hypothetical protein [Candidatus Gottesmanbacteria bacterium]
MAEFALAGDEGGHSWNNALAHATYAENVAKLGEETARAYLRADIKSWIQERKGQETRWSLTLQDGQMVTETGVSLTEMTENITHGPHSHLVPEHIKATAHLEAATLSEATRLAALGAKRIMLPEQHLDEQGNVVSRYLSVWTQSADDPTRYDGGRIDLGKNIRIEDVRTGTSFVAFEGNGVVRFHQHTQEKHAFVVSVAHTETAPFEAVRKKIVERVYRSHQETYSRPASPGLQRGEPASPSRSEPPAPFVREQSGTLHEKKVCHEHIVTEVPRAIIRDTRETMRGVAVYLRKKREKENLRSQTVESPLPRPAVRLDQAPERLTIQTIHAKPERVGDVIHMRHAVMHGDRKAIAVIARTGVAVHALPILLSRMSEPMPSSVRALEKSVRRHEKKVRKVREVSFGKTQDKREVQRGYGEGKWKKEKGKKENKKIMKRRSQKQMQKAVGLESFKRKERVRPEKQRTKRLRRIMRSAERILERMPIAKKEKKLRVMLSVAAVEFKKLASQGRTLQIEKDVQMLTKPGFQRSKPGFGEDVGLHEHAAAAGMWFAWMVWIALGQEKMSEKNYVNSLSVESKFTSFGLDTLVYKHKGKKENLDFQQGLSVEVVGGKKKRGGNDTEVSTPWVLLSIIYYLTALREQAMHNTTNPTNTTNNQMNKSNTVILRHAVIFVYAS